MIAILRKLFGSTQSAKAPEPVIPADRPVSNKTRLGQHIPTDQAFDAWTSGDLAKMLSALDKKTNKIDRHFLLMGIVDATYKQRFYPKMSQLCCDISELHLSEFPSMVEPLKKDMGGILPRVTTFQLYATLLADRGEFEKAIQVCELAIGYGLHDGTKSNFPGRIERIKKAQAGT